MAHGCLSKSQICDSHFGAVEEIADKDYGKSTYNLQIGGSILRARTKRGTCKDTHVVYFWVPCTENIIGRRLYQKNGMQSMNKTCVKTFWLGILLPESQFIKIDSEYSFQSRKLMNKCLIKSEPFSWTFRLLWFTSSKKRA